MVAWGLAVAAFGIPLVTLLRAVDLHATGMDPPEQVFGSLHIHDRCRHAPGGAPEGTTPG